MNDHYTYRVCWSNDSQEFLAQCTEFPSLTWLAETPEQAMQGIRSLVAEILEDMRQTGEIPPVPLGERQFSGQFMVRIPLSLHRSLTTEAAEQGVSLNRLVASKLAL